MRSFVICILQGFIIAIIASVLGMRANQWEWWAFIIICNILMVILVRPTIAKYTGWDID